MDSSSSGSIYDDTLAVFTQRQTGFEPLTTPEVADELDVKRRTVYKRLRTLVDRGELETKETGANSRIWWRQPVDSTAASGETPSTPPAEQEWDLPSDLQDRDQSSDWEKLVVDKAPDGIVIHDPEGAIWDVNEAIVEMLGYSREELRSMQISDVEVGVSKDRLREAWRSLSPGVMERADFEGVHQRKDGSTYPAEVWVSKVTTSTENGPLLIALIRDITQRKERERDLERYERIIDAVQDPVYELDSNGQITYVNDALREQTGFNAGELFGQPAKNVMPEEDHTKAEARIRELLRDDTRQSAKLEYELRTKSGERIPVENHFTTLLDENDQFYGTAGVLRDITERLEREQQLRETARQLRGILDTVEAAVFLKDTDGTYLRMNENGRKIHGIAEYETVVGKTDLDLFPQAIAAENRATDLQALERRETVTVEQSVPAGDKDRSFLTRKTPIIDDAGTIQGLCAVSTDITDRKARERELDRQRKQLQTSNQISEIVLEITHEVVDCSTREEIEQAVCDRLAAAESYAFAWIGAVEMNEAEVEPRAEAGVDGYLEDIPLSIDRDDPTGQGPTGMSVATGEMQVSQNVLEEPSFEPWYEYARKYGYRSSASIPIVHENTLYGVIGLASERTDAFDEGERKIVARIGEVVGHAIAAVEKKRAVLTDDVVELAFRMHDVELRGLAPSSDGRIVMDRILPLEEETYLQYGTATEGEMDTVRSLVESDLTPHAEPLRVIDSLDGKTRFEVRLNEPAFLPAILDAGGYVHEVQIEAGTYVILVHLPPTADVRQVVDAVRASYPATEMVARGQTERANPDQRQVQQLLSSRLTERQQASLEAAYAMGFFEWPRSSSGSDVADSLDISSSTFHQHLRKAEQKLLELIFEVDM